MVLKSWTNTVRGGLSSASHLSRFTVSIAGSALFCLYAEYGWSHGKPAPTPDPADTSWQESARPIGATQFHKALSEQRSFLLSTEEAEKLALVGEHFVYAADNAASNREVSEYNQYLGEELLLGMLGTHQSLVSFDLRNQTTSQNDGGSAMLPPLEGSVILRFEAGDGPTHLLYRDLNVSFSGDGKPIEQSIAIPGTTYLLLNLDEIPFGPNTLTFALTPLNGGPPQYWQNLNLFTQPPAQLSVTIRDEHGEPAPALVRIEETATGRMWEPPNAVDLGPIMTQITGLPIYGPGRGYTHFFPGGYRGTFWIVPDDFETALPPGEWTVTVARGYEYAIERATFEVGTRGHVNMNVALERWIDMPAKGWWAGDDHVHARLLHSEDAERVLDFAEAEGVYMVNVHEMGNYARTWYTQRGFGPAFRVQRGNHYLIPGQEDPRAAFGHALGLNLTGLARNTSKYMLHDWVADEIHRQGGLYGHTHVGEGGLGIIRDMTLLIPRGKSDFSSIMQNILGTERYYRFLNLGYKMTASAGSDTPYGGAIGVTRVYAYLGEGQPLDPDQWFEQMRKGHTFVTNGPMINLRVNDALPGSELEIGEEEDIHVKATVYGLPGESGPAEIMVIRNGEVVHRQQFDGNTRECTIDYSFTESYGCWVALRARGINGSEGHTTPVYISRPGFRHWKLDAVEDLVAERNATLDEILQVVQAAEDRYNAGSIPAVDNWDLPIALNAEEIRERVTLVRGLYAELLDTAQTERETINGSSNGH